MEKPRSKTSLWKPQQKTLEAAGLWAFIKDSSQFPYPDQQTVVSFVKTMDNPTTLTGMVNLRTLHLKNKDVSKWLKIPGTPDVVKKVDYPNQPWKDVFQGGIAAWDGQTWDLEKALAPYDEWFNFINYHFLFEDHPTRMTMDMVQKARASWEGERVDWAQVVEENILKQLWTNP